jgi:hypothetical protein
MFRPAAPLALILTLFLAGCGDDNGNYVGDILSDPEPLVIAGEWSTSTTEVLDTCGFDPFPPYSPLLVEESGSTVVFTFNDGLGNCQESVRQRTGNTVSLIKTDTIDGGCGLVRVQSHYLYEFTQTSLSGTATHQYSMLDGNCSNVPCTYQLAVGGHRCQDCWPGCATVSSSGPLPPSGDVESDRGGLRSR